jgi:diadenosine tetraphosphate (Ap4A) HIT family hydrolase
MTSCTTCALVHRRDAGEAPPWDQIRRTPYWDVVHAYGTAVEGWLVLVVRRHVTAMADLTDDEAAELGPLITSASRALHATVGCAKTYVAQFAEHPDHPHVHVHVVPRAADLPAESRGPRVFGGLGVPEDQQVPEERRNEIAAALRRHL